ncbi:MAG: hypothetical protein QOH63_3698 [Acidobacteriota bacterium]|jgi:hypothetical protein|nr:hypothetical protein [Acidobacteriota bacterium]
MRSRLVKAFLVLTLLLAGSVSPFDNHVSTAHVQGNYDRQLTARARQITGDDFPVFTRTPNGARVFARISPRPEVLRSIDDGLTELFRVARRHGYTARLDYSYYTIFIARADRTKDSQGAYSPDIAVPAGQYAGSGYDQGGYIYAAGMVLAFNPCAFIIAEHERDLQRISNVVRYEGEHLILYYNDRALYEKTADHSRGGGHPILQ